MAVFRVMKNKDYTVMCNYHLRDKNLSLKAVGLLSKMLSLADEWNYTNRGLAAICKEGVDAIGSTLRELEQYGYLVRRQLRAENGRILDTEYIIYEMPQCVLADNGGNDGTEGEDADNTSAAGISETVTPESISREKNSSIKAPVVDTELSDSDTAVPYTENPYTAASDTENTAQLNKDIVNTDLSSTNSSFHPVTDRLDYETAASLIRENIEYPILAQQYKKSKLDMVVELAAELLCSPSDQVSIGRETYPYDIVKNRMLRLDSECVNYAFDSIDEASGNIRCIKPYLQKILFNAPVTMDSYIEAQANSALRKYYGGGTVR